MHGNYDQMICRLDSKKDAIIIASIIEKETPQIKELKLVSGVIMNRLKIWYSIGYGLYDCI